MSGSELLIVLVAAIVLFGGRRMPYLARNAASVYREFRRAYEELKRQITVEIAELEDLENEPKIEKPKLNQKEKG